LGVLGRDILEVENDDEARLSLLGPGVHDRVTREQILVKGAIDGNGGAGRGKYLDHSTLIGSRGNLGEVSDGEAHVGVISDDAANDRDGRRVARELNYRALREK